MCWWCCVAAYGSYSYILDFSKAFITSGVLVFLALLSKYQPPTPPPSVFAARHGKVVQNLTCSFSIKQSFMVMLMVDYSFQNVLRRWGQRITASRMCWAAYPPGPRRARRRATPKYRGMISLPGSRAVCTPVLNWEGAAVDSSILYLLGSIY